MDKKSLHPVHYAASKGHVDLLVFLSSKGADLDVEDAAGRTPLHFAAAFGHKETIKFLIEKCVWLDGFDSEDNSALHLAARLEICMYRGFAHIVHRVLFCNA